MFIRTHSARCMKSLLHAKENFCWYSKIISYYRVLQYYKTTLCAELSPPVYKEHGCSAFPQESLGETADSSVVISVQYEWWYFTSGFLSTRWCSSRSAPLKKHDSRSQSFFLAHVINKVIKKDYSMIKYLSWRWSKFYLWKVNPLVSAGLFL